MRRTMWGAAAAVAVLVAAAGTGACDSDAPGRVGGPDGGGEVGDADGSASADGDGDGGEVAVADGEGDGDGGEVAVADGEGDGGEVAVADGDGDGGEVAVADGEGDGDGGEVAVADVGGEVADGGGAAGCGEAAAALAAELYASIGAFTAVVRLDYETQAVLGYALVVGKYGGLDEAGASAAAQAATGFGAAGALLGGPAPEDVWVFWEAPGDFGGVGAVSAHTGLAVFGGSIVWDGTGDISWPSAWSPAEGLASGCAAAGGPGQVRGFDLEGGTALDEGEVDGPVGVVAQTALLEAMWFGGYVFDTVVLRYPRSVGAFDPATAEWIVLVSGGWLE